MGIVDIPIKDLKRLKQIIEHDTKFLEELNIMDYSLYLVIEILDNSILREMNYFGNFLKKELDHRN